MYVRYRTNLPDWRFPSRKCRVYSESPLKERHWGRERKDRKWKSKRKEAPSLKKKKAHSSISPATGAIVSLRFSLLRIPFRPRHMLPFRISLAVVVPKGVRGFKRDLVLRRHNPQINHLGTVCNCV